VRVHLADDLGVVAAERDVASACPGSSATARPGLVRTRLPWPAASGLTSEIRELDVSAMRAVPGLLERVRRERRSAFCTEIVRNAPAAARLARARAYGNY